jgi:hypothetical protein
VLKKKVGKKKPTSGYCKLPKSLYFTVFKKNCKLLFLEKFRQKKKRKKKGGCLLLWETLPETFQATFWF